jgi:hypothetical protein
MKKDTLKSLRETDDLWRWAERHESREEEPGWLERWKRRWLPRKEAEDEVCRQGD